MNEVEAVKAAIANTTLGQQVRSILEKNNERG